LRKKNPTYLGPMWLMIIVLKTLFTQAIQSYDPHFFEKEKSHLTNAHVANGYHS
jgi:hypothetical protein